MLNEDEYKVGDNVLVRTYVFVTNYNGEQCGIVETVLPKHAGSDETSYRIYGQGFTMITRAGEMRRDPNHTLVLVKA